MRPGRLPRPQKLRHALAIRDAFVEFRLAERRNAFELVDFKFEEDLAGEPIFRSAGLIPDALATLRRGDTVVTVGVEVDCGTETTTTLCSKMVAWRAVLPHLTRGELLVVVLGAARARTCARLASEAALPAVALHANDLGAHLRRTQPLFAPAVRAVRTAVSVHLGVDARVSPVTGGAFRALLRSSSS